MRKLESIKALFYSQRGVGVLLDKRNVPKERGPAVASRNYPPLTQSQKSIMGEFYSHKKEKVVLRKAERQEIWDSFKKSKVFPDANVAKTCPALIAELDKAIINKKGVQSAVFSECAYAQTIANMLGLTNFVNCAKNSDELPDSILDRVEILKLKPRYVYKSADGLRSLVQAGGPAAIDSVLISTDSDRVYKIEFKEPAAKTTEADLPIYGEEGFFIVSEKFLKKHSQYDQMLREQVDKKLNIWSVSGTNVNDFGDDAIEAAVTANYSKEKQADVICVEDTNGYLTMIPANEAGVWATTKGEIRSTGRNDRKVWTPNKLREILAKLGGEICGDVVKIPVTNLDTSTRRGGNAEVGRYRIESLFFIREENIKVVGDTATFNLSDVRQSKPTISAHMFFKELDFDTVYEHYRSGL